MDNKKSVWLYSEIKLENGFFAEGFCYFSPVKKRPYERFNILDSDKSTLLRHNMLLTADRDGKLFLYKDGIFYTAGLQKDFSLPYSVAKLRKSPLKDELIAVLGNMPLSLSVPVSIVLVSFSLYDDSGGNVLVYMRRSANSKSGYLYECVPNGGDLWEKLYPALLEEGFAPTSYISYINSFMNPDSGDTVEDEEPDEDLDDEAMADVPDENRQADEFAVKPITVSASPDRASYLVEQTSNAVYKIFEEADRQIGISFKAMTAQKSPEGVSEFHHRLFVCASLLNIKLKLNQDSKKHDRYRSVIKKFLTYAASAKSTDRLLNYLSAFGMDDGNVIKLTEALKADRGAIIKDMEAYYDYEKDGKIFFCWKKLLRNKPHYLLADFEEFCDKCDQMLVKKLLKYHSDLFESRNSDNWNAVYHAVAQYMVYARLFNFHTELVDFMKTVSDIMEIIERYTALINSKDLLNRYRKQIGLKKGDLSYMLPDSFMEDERRQALSAANELIRFFFDIYGR